MQLICVIVSAYLKSRFSQDMAHIKYHNLMTWLNDVFHDILKTADQFEFLRYCKIMQKQEFTQVIGN